MEELLKPINFMSSRAIKWAGQNVLYTDLTTLKQTLAESLFDSDYNHELLVDWTYAVTHPLILEVDVNPKIENNYDRMIRYVNRVLFNALYQHLRLPELTLILAMRRNKCSGLHVYVVGIELTHDDYIELCQRMRRDCFCKEDEFTIYLKTPSTFFFPGSDIKNESQNTTYMSLYVPFHLVRVRFDLNCDKNVSYQLENVFLRKPEQKSFFDNMAYYPAQWKAVASAMIPVSQPNSTLLYYKTRIVPGIDSSPLAQFKSSLNQCTYSIVKDKTLTQSHTREISFCYEFLKLNAAHIEFLISLRSAVLITWYKRFQVKESQLTHFQHIDQKLKKLCPHLKYDRSPLETVLKAFPYPVYYALFNLTNDIDAIHSQFPFLSKEIELPNEAKNLTFETILYLAYQVAGSCPAKEPKKEVSRFTRIGMGWDWILANSITLQEMKKHVRFLQRKLFPVIKSSETVYFWDAVIQKWLQLKNPPEDLKQVLEFTVDIMSYFDGYLKIPEKLRNILKNEMYWKKSIINDILIELEKSKTVRGNHITKPFIVYGQNVPEYYFLKKNKSILQKC